MEKFRASQTHLGRNTGCPFVDGISRDQRGGNDFLFVGRDRNRWYRRQLHNRPKMSQWTTSRCDSDIPANMADVEGEVAAAAHFEPSRSLGKMLRAYKRQAMWSDASVWMLAAQHAFGSGESFEKI